MRIVLVLLTFLSACAPAFTSVPARLVPPTSEEATICIVREKGFVGMLAKLVHYDNGKMVQVTMKNGVSACYPALPGTHKISSGHGIYNHFSFYAQPGQTYAVVVPGMFYLPTTLREGESALALLGTLDQVQTELKKEPGVPIWRTPIAAQ